ncbi:MAG: peptide-methionine (S)-S-oxide reductase MsrA [Ignavibacteria bacterium]|jgi:methionine-S-sulfoxide reductase
MKSLFFRFFFWMFGLLALTSTSQSCTPAEHHVPPATMIGNIMTPSSDTRDTAILAGGCFWCIEAVYEIIDGVLSVESGYSGGAVKNPTYKEVCAGTTGHAEVCRVVFDTEKVSYADILQMFFAAHDPTTLNRQGNDVGTQYRSAIFTTSAEQRQTALAYIKQLSDAKTFAGPIVTEVVDEDVFYPAEDYHQNYYEQNGGQPYCAFVVRPKVEKFQKQFQDRLRSK